MGHLVSATSNESFRSATVLYIFAEMYTLPHSTLWLNLQKWTTWKDGFREEST